MKGAHADADALQSVAHQSAQRRQVPTRDQLVTQARHLRLNGLAEGAGISVLVFLILRQVMPTAAGLAGGLALSSFGFMSGTAGFAMHQGRVTAWPARASWRRR